MHPYLNKRGTVPGYSSTSLIIAADAAVNDTETKTGLAYLATNGAWGMRLRPSGAPVLTGDRDGLRVTDACELRAVHYALRDCSVLDAVTVLSDSRIAVRRLRDWQAGGMLTAEEERLELARLHALIAATPGRFHFRWAPRETHPLHQFADSVAKLALRVNRRVNSSQATDLPPVWAETRLQEWGTHQEE